mgnify:CR=1 FL=1
MKKVNVEITLYEFKELSNKAKCVALDRERGFLLEIDDNADSNELMDDEYVIENIEANDYLFFSDGSLAQCVTYCGGHTKTGKTEFMFQDKVYEI